MASWDSKRLVFIDESGVKTNMTRLYGRATRGMRANDSAPHGHWGVRSLISSVRADGETACLSVDAATDAEIFQTYVQKILVPTLKPGDIVVMDNLSSHKSPAVEKAISAAGASVEYLPAYSPDLNPIEKMWSKIKSHFGRQKPELQEHCTRQSEGLSMQSHRKTLNLGLSHVAILFLKML